MSATIRIYATYLKINGALVPNTKTLIQEIPSGSEDKIRLINPTVKNQIGNAESFEFSLQPGTEYYDAFYQMRSFIEVWYKDVIIFYGRVLTYSNDFYGNRKFHCEGPITFLNDSFYPPFDKKEMSVFDYITKIISNHNDQLNDSFRAINIGEIPGNYTSSSVSSQRLTNKSREFDSTSWTQSKSALEDLKSHYGGLFHIRVVSSNGKPSGTTRLYLDWVNHYYRSTVNTQTVETGKNLINISDSTEINNIFTAVIPIGKTSSGDKKIYLTGYSGHGLSFNNNYIKVPQITSIYTDDQLKSGYHTADDYRNAVNNYGMIFKTVEFQEASTQSKLLIAVAEWIKENYQGSITSFSVKAVDLHLIGDESVDSILVGDRVKLVYKVGLEDGGSRKATQTLTCTSVTYDLYNPENNQYEFGIPANSLSKNYGTKATKSKQNITQPTNDYSNYTPEETDPQKLWLDDVFKWLRGHRVWYRSTGDKEDGPYPSGGSYSERLRNERNNLFRIESSVDENGNAKVSLFKPNFRISSTGSHLDIIWNRDDQRRPLTNWTVGKEEDLYKYSKLKEYKLFEYVKMEYGVDLCTSLAHPMPDVIVEDENGGGGIYIQQNAENRSHIDTSGYYHEGDDGSFRVAITPEFSSALNEYFVNTSILLGGNDGSLTTFTSNNQGVVSAATRIAGDAITQFMTGLDGSGTNQPSIQIQNGNINFYNRDTDNPYESLSIGEGGDGKIDIRTRRSDGSLASQLNEDAFTQYGQNGRKALEMNKGVIDLLIDGDLKFTDSDSSIKSVRSLIGGKNVKDFIDELNASGIPAGGLINKVNIMGDTIGDRNSGMIKRLADQGKTINSLLGAVNILGAPEVTPEMEALIEELAEEGIGVNALTNQVNIIGETVGDETKGIIKELTDQGLSVTAITDDVVIIEGRLDGHDARIGTLETDYLKTSYLTAKYNIAAGDLSARNFYIDTGIDSEMGTYNLKDAVAHANITLTGNTYTLHLYKTTGGEIDALPGQSLTFSRATTLTGTWGGVVDGRSGRTYTVKATPQGNEHVLTLADGNVAPAADALTGSWDGNTYTGKVAYATAEVGGTQHYADTRLRYVVDGLPRYKAGWNGARGAMEIPTTAIGDIVQNSFTVKKPDADAATTKTDYVYSMDMGADNFKPTGSTSTVKCVELKYGSTVVARFDINTLWTNRYKSGWNNARNAMDIPTESIGTDVTNSLTIQKPNADGASTKTSYTYSMAMGADNFKPTGSTSTVKCVELKYGSTVVARFDINTLWTNRYNAGWNGARTVVVNNLPLTDIGHGTGSSIAIKVPKTNGSSSTDTYTYAMSLTSHTPASGTAYKCIELKNSGNVVARLSINTEWNDRYNAGKNSVLLAESWSGGTLSVTKSTSGSESRTYAVTSAVGLTYNSSTHKYTAKAQAKVNATNRGDPDSKTSGTEAYDAGYDVGYLTGYAAGQSAASHNIDLVTRNEGGCGTYTTTLPSGYSYTQAYSWVSSGSTSVKYLGFKVTCGDQTKYYYIDVSKYR